MGKNIQKPHEYRAEWIEKRDENQPEVALIDERLTTGKYTWEIELKNSTAIQIGVCKRDISIQGLHERGHFWAFSPMTGAIWINRNFHGRIPGWEQDCKVGDKIKVHLECKAHQYYREKVGVFGISVNGKFLGNLCEDFHLPVWPFVALYTNAGCILNPPENED